MDLRRSMWVTTEGLPMICKSEALYKINKCFSLLRYWELSRSATLFVLISNIYVFIHCLLCNVCVDYS